MHQFTPGDPDRCGECGRVRLVPRPDQQFGRDRLGATPCLEEAAGRPACRPVWAMSFPELVLRRGAQEALINRAEWRIRGAVQDRTLELEGVWSEPMPLIRAGDFIDIDAEGKVERFLVTEAGVTQETLEMATIGAGRTVHRQRVGRGDVTIEARPTDFAPGPPPPKPLATQAEEAERRLAETREACEGFDLDDLT